MTALAWQNYSDRVCDPAATWRKLIESSEKYGITRLARQTGLDRIGIPCFSAIRPNSMTLSTSQGKGLSDDAAKASALMEALEYAVAEAPQVESIFASWNELASDGRQTFDAERFLPPNTVVDRSCKMEWFQGRGLITHHSTFVPADLVRQTGIARNLKGICQTTNGLASGNVEEEAIFHGLCELVERDANTLWLLSSEDRRALSTLDPAELRDPGVLDLVSLINRAGLKLRLFDQTSDLGVPTVMALIGETTGANRKFQVTAGYGCHPVSYRAAIRAITEAAQSRITAIASARDDILPDEFDEPVSEFAATLLEIEPGFGHAPADLCSQDTLALMTKRIVSRIMAQELAEPIVVPLTATNAPFSVVRMLSSDLEDAQANLNWRPGHRAKKMMARL